MITRFLLIITGIGLILFLYDMFFEHSNTVDAEDSVSDASFDYAASATPVDDVISDSVANTVVDSFGDIL